MERNGPLYFLAAAALAYYVVMFPWALVLWEKVPLMSYLQSPWRLLPFLILATSALAGYLGRWASDLRPGWRYAALAALALLVTVPNVVNLQPRYVDLREDEVSILGSLRFEILSQNLGMTAAGEYLPKGVRSKMGSSPLALDALTLGRTPPPFDYYSLPSGTLLDVLESRTTLTHLSVGFPERTNFVFSQTYFPGWRALLDGAEVPLTRVGTANQMAVQVPPGKHELELRFQDTRVRALGQGVSLASFMALAALGCLALWMQTRRRRGTAETDRTTVRTSTPDGVLPLAVLVLVLTALLATFLLQGSARAARSMAPYPVEISWRGGPVLLGYDLSSSRPRPGQTLDLALFWKGQPPQQEVRLGLKGRTGRIWGQTEGETQPLGQDGAVSSERRRIGLPADLPPGMYAIVLDIIGEGKPLPIQEERLARPIFPEKSLLLGPVFVPRVEPELAEGVSIPTRREANLENKASLLGYNLVMGARSIDLTTYWKANSVMREDYSIFAHLLDMGEKVLVYKDLQPEGNPYPTTLWRPGELVTVPFRFDLPPEFAPEKHRIAIGLYTPDNFRRLSVLDPAGQPVTNTVFIPLAPAER